MKPFNFHDTPEAAPLLWHEPGSDLGPYATTST
jgi:hypothetical protein